MRQGHLQRAYSALLHYLMELKGQISKEYPTGNLSSGYMDYSYFPFTTTDFLRTHKLRFGVVLNHTQMRFELWLMGQNQAAKDKYWGLLRTSKWAKNCQRAHPYAIVTVPLLETVDFNHKTAMTTTILSNTRIFSSQIEYDLTTI